jgi:hypothetical protein
MELRIDENEILLIEDVIQIAVTASHEILKIYNTDIEVIRYLLSILSCGTQNWNSSFAGDESPLSHAQEIAFKIIYNGNLYPILRAPFILLCLSRTPRKIPHNPNHLRIENS